MRHVGQRILAQDQIKLGIATQVVVQDLQRLYRVTGAIAYDLEVFDLKGTS